MIELSAGCLVFSSRSPTNKSPLVVRIPIEPVECPGIERTVAAKPYSARSWPSVILISGVTLSDLSNLKSNGAIALKIGLCFAPACEHVATFDHAKVVRVHGEERAELLLKISRIARMIEIAVGQ